MLTKVHVLTSWCYATLAVAGMALVATFAFAAETATPYPGLRPVSAANPTYPRAALLRNIQGYVVIEFGTDEEGRVINPAVVENCTWRPPVTEKSCVSDDIFDAAALTAIAKWKYQPELENGIAVQRQGAKAVLQFRLQR